MSTSVSKDRETDPTTTTGAKKNQSKSSFSCRCRNISLSHSISASRSTDKQDTGTQTKTEDGSYIIDVLYPELSAYTSIEVDTSSSRSGSKVENKEERRRDSVSGSRTRRRSNDFPKQYPGSTGQAGNGERSTGLTIGKNGPARFPSDNETEDGNEDSEEDEQEREKFMVCTICEEKVASVRLGRKGSDQIEQVLEVLLDGEGEDEPKEISLFQPLALSNFELSESYGAPPNLPRPPPIPPLLAPLSDPFFLPPPFTPSHPFFQTLSTRASEEIKNVRDRVDAEIEEFVRKKRKEVGAVQRKARGECEMLWKAFERAGKLSGKDVSTQGEEKGQQPGRANELTSDAKIPFKESFKDASNEKREDIPSGRVSGIGRFPSNGTGMGQGQGNSLLSASLSVSYFHQASPGGAAGSGNTTPRDQATVRANEPQIKQGAESFSQSMNIRDKGTRGDLVTKPFNRSKPGIDLDVVSSLRISNMDDHFGSSFQAQGRSSNNAIGLSETFLSGSRKGNRLNNPLDTDLNPRDPALLDASPPTKLDRVMEHDEEVREGGEGDINLNPFAESSQVSAASSYREEFGGDENKTQGETINRRGRATQEVAEEERTPRPRNVKHLSSSSPETIKRNTLGSVRKSSFLSGGGEAGRTLTTEGESKQERRKVKFEESVVAREEEVSVGEVAREGPGEDEPEDAGLISAADDAVFDFEDHDAPPVSSLSASSSLVEQDFETAQASASPASENVNKTMKENTQLVEKKLIQLMAADAPSHRSAWRNDTQKLWQALGTTTNRSFVYPGTGARERRESEEAEDDSDDGQTSLFATSMPVRIALPRPSGTNNAILEPKTSLVEKQGMMVPPLKTAMRRGSKLDKSDPQGQGMRSSTGRDPIAGHAENEDNNKQDHTISTSTNIPNITINSSRQNSISRDPTSYSMRPEKGYGGFSVDPGPALEAMGSLSEEEEDAYSASVKAGGFGFVPPHRQERT